MMLEYSKDNDKIKEKFIKMTRDEYDKYMCEKYPDFFEQRNWDMRKTCMCWGFDIGPGWYWILDELCQSLKLISNIAGIGIAFVQIKEKFGSGRFYYNMKPSEKLSREENELLETIISQTISDAERKCVYVCAECAKYKDEIIRTGYWDHDACEECLIKDDKKIKDYLDEVKEMKEIKSLVEDKLFELEKDDLESIKKLIDEKYNEKKAKMANPKEIKPGSCEY